MLQERCNMTWSRITLYMDDTYLYIDARWGDNHLPVDIDNMMAYWLPIYQTYGVAVTSHFLR